jgi:hypothetical protein
LISVHAQKEKDDKDDQRKPREGHYNKPQKKNVRGKKKNTSLKKKKGGGKPYTSRRPLQPFWLFFSGLNLSPHQTLFIPQSQPPGAATPHKKRAYHTGEQHCAQPPHPRKKGSLVFRLLLPAVFPFRPSSS